MANDFSEYSSDDFSTKQPTSTNKICSCSWGRKTWYNIVMLPRRFNKEIVWVEKPGTEWVEVQCSFSNRKRLSGRIGGQQTILAYQKNSQVQCRWPWLQVELDPNMYHYIIIHIKRKKHRENICPNLAKKNPNPWNICREVTGKDSEICKTKFSFTCSP